MNEMSAVECACSSSTDMGIPSTTTTFDGIQQIKSASFSPYPLFHEVLSRSDYSCNEVRSTWYDRDESAMREAELKETAILVVARAGFDTARRRASFCKRGLEWMLSGDQRRAEAEEAQKAVLEEQALQRYEGVSDCDLLADIYFECNRESQAMAQSTAQQDEIDARDECMSTCSAVYFTEKEVATLPFVRAAHYQVNACAVA